MYRAVLRKELRETLLLALAAAAAYSYLLAQSTGWEFLFRSALRQRDQVAFVDDNYVTFFTMISAAFAVGLGLWQTLWESGRGTWLFLLHRPASRRTLIGAKLAVGTVTYLVVSSTAILVYAAWAATPGNLAAPFHWWITQYAWIACLLMVSVYLATFLSGIRPGRLLGTRLFPLLGTGLPIYMAFIMAAVLGRWWPLAVAATAVNVILVWLILNVTDQRDYS